MPRYRVGDLVIFPEGRPYAVFHKKRESTEQASTKVSTGSIRSGTVAHVYNVGPDGDLDLFFFYGDNYANGFQETSDDFHLLKRNSDNG